MTKMAPLASQKSVGWVVSCLCEPSIRYHKPCFVDKLLPIEKWISDFFSPIVVVDNHDFLPVRRS